MAMSGDVAAAAAKTTLEALAVGQGYAGATADLDYLKALCNAIIDEIKTNGHATGKDTPSADDHNLSLV